MTSFETETESQPIARNPSLLARWMAKVGNAISNAAASFPITYNDGTYEYDIAVASPGSMALSTQDSPGNATSAQFVSSVDGTNEGSWAMTVAGPTTTFDLKLFAVDSPKREALNLENGSANSADVILSGGAPTSSNSPKGSIGIDVTTPALYQYSGSVWTKFSTGSPSGSAGGDLTGTYPNPTVAALRGHTVKNASPSDAQILVWNNSNADWEPVSLSGGVTITNAGVATVSAGFSSVITGDGSDGALSLTQSSSAPAWASKSGSGASTVFTLSRDIYGSSLHLDNTNGNFTLATANYRIFVGGTTTIDSGIVMSNDGNPASGAAAGAVTAAGTLGSNGNGGTGSGAGGGNGANATSSVAKINLNSLTASGGAGGSSGGGGGTGGGTGTAGQINNGFTNGQPSNLVQALSGRTQGGGQFNGGAGGAAGDSAGGAASGGGGGAGGCILLLSTVNLVNNGTIRAKGGNGAAAIGSGNAGGGGGGGGGAVILVFGASGSTIGSTDVTGGTGGNPIGTGNKGANGQAGQLWTLTY